MSLKHILNDDPPLHAPQPLQQQHLPPPVNPNPIPNRNGALSLVVTPQPSTPLSPSSHSSQRDPRSPAEPRNGDPARDYMYQQHPGVYQPPAPPAPWEHHNGDRLQPDDIPSGPSSSYHAEQEESATPSPRISNGTPAGLSKEGSVETSGRVLRKRKLPPDNDDEDYQPPGQKRVSWLGFRQAGAFGVADGLGCSNCAAPHGRVSSLEITLPSRSRSTTRLPKSRWSLQRKRRSCRRIWMSAPSSGWRSWATM